MQFLLDFIPIVLFFIVFHFYDIYFATAAAMLASILQVAYMWFRYHKVDKVPLFTMLIVLVMGSATLLFHNEWFIKWKPTVLYWLMSAFIIVRAMLGKQPISSKLLDGTVTLREQYGYTVDKMIYLFLIAMGVLNIWVAYTFSTDTWVYFKLFGALALTLLFAIGVSCYIAKHADSIEMSNKNV